MKANVSPLHKYHQVKAFTLVELIVALGLVAILCTLVFAKVQSARVAAKGVECIHNLMQAGRAALQFSAEAGNTLLTGYGGNVSSGDLWGAKVVSLNYLTDKRVLRCPLGETSRSFEVGTWPWETYGLNLFQDGTLSRDKAGIAMWELRMHDIVERSKFVLLSDNCELSAASGKYLQSFRILSSPSIQGGVALYHQGRANVFFADGHAGSVSRGELQQLGINKVREAPFE